MAEDLNFPGAGLHPLKGDLKGYWTVSVTGNYRIINAYSIAPDKRAQNAKGQLVDFISSPPFAPSAKPLCFTVT